MAKTNWQDPGASEILSTQISGLQDAVSKMETILNIETESDTDIPLSYVTSYDPDTGLQTYRLFQAPVGKRNWLSTPSPVIKKNGTTISSDFYIDYGGGAVVFTTPVTVSDVITANVTYTIDEGDAGGGISPDMIVDDLTTNDPTKVLSAKQGKVLKDNADDLAGTGRTTETVKANADSMVSHGNSLTPHQFEDKRNNKKYLFGFQVSAEGNPQIIYEEVENE